VAEARGAVDHESNGSRFLVRPTPLAREIESRGCPQGPRFLEPGESLVIFAAGSREVGIGKPLPSVEWPPSNLPWLAVALKRVL
jgi:hypothetical protein